MTRTTTTLFPNFATFSSSLKKTIILRSNYFGIAPISREIGDLAEIYGGFADEESKRIVMNLSIRQIEALIDLAKKIRKTVGSPSAHPALDETLFISPSPGR